jgi:hypothetical protein
MNWKRLILILLLIPGSLLVFPQAVIVTDDASYTTGHASSMLDVKSISKGILFPRLTQSERNSISSPATGLIIFQTDNTPGFYYYTGSGWSMVGPTADGSETKISAGTNVTVTGSGTSGSPYVVNQTAANGSETKIDAGTNVTVTGSGTSASHYVINVTAANGSETKIDAGTNVTVTGSGTTGSPYVINSTGGDGSETKVNAGTNVSVTGSGTSASHYVVNSTGGDGSETKVNQGTAISVTGTGTSGNPYVVNYRTQSVTVTERNALTGLVAGRYVWCNNCGTSGELQIYNGTSWTNFAGSPALPALPTVTTTAESNKKSTTATSGGNVTDAGGGTITERGLCWKTSSGPTVADTKKTSGTGTGSYTIYLNKLSPSTTYYLRAYAVNSAGTAYGNEINFTTNAYALGDTCQGGTIAYLNGSGGGLVVPASDQGSLVKWLNTTEETTNATGTAMGTGDANTRQIVAVQGAGTYAAQLCYDLVSGGFSDWFLPSKDELNNLNKSYVPNYQSTGYYWSSSESNQYDAWRIAASGGALTSYGKVNQHRVRAVREIIAVGNSYGGGKVAYILQPGDPGYVAGEIHGLVVTSSDVSASALWGCNTTTTGATRTALGTGGQNTSDIVAGCATAGIAGRLCNDLVQNGYSDWYLPSKDEMTKIWISRAVLGTFSSTFYWTSTEFSASQAYYHKWSDGTQVEWGKTTSTMGVRAVRYF